MGQLFHPDRYRRTAHTGSADRHEYTFVFTRVDGIPATLRHKMGCVELISNFFRAFLITRAKNVTRNFPGITLNMPFHKILRMKLFTAPPDMAAVQLLAKLSH